MIRILKSVAIITAVVAIAGGGTYALLTDSAQIIGSTFSASTMDLMIDKNPSGDDDYVWSQGFDNPSNPFARVKPGSNGEQIIDLKNVGDVAGAATIKFDVTEWSALADNLIFTVLYDFNHDGDYETTVATGTVAQWNGNVYPLGNMTGDTDNPSEPGYLASVKIMWNVPSTAGNNIQGQSIKIDTTFGLEQI